MSAVVGVIIVDHGSRRRESNEMLHEATARFAAQSEFSIVEPAHMELAEPTIAQPSSWSAEGPTRVMSTVSALTRSHVLRALLHLCANGANMVVDATLS